MAAETKGKLLEIDEVRQKISDLKKRVAEMADYIRIDERRGRVNCKIHNQRGCGANINPSIY